MSTSCPNCGSSLLPSNLQPDPTKVTFKTRYECGSLVIYVIRGGYWEYVDECPVEIEDDGK